MPILYEVVELANGDIALQREGDNEGQPLVTMRFSTELLRFLRNGKLDIAKIMIEAGLEEVAKLAADFTDKDRQSGADEQSTPQQRSPRQDSPEQGRTPRSSANVAEQTTETSAAENSPARKVGRRPASRTSEQGNNQFRRRTDKQQPAANSDRALTLKNKKKAVHQQEEEFLVAEAGSQLIH